MNRIPNATVIHTQVSPTILMEEVSVGNGFHGPRATLTSDDWPGPVHVLKSPHVNSFKLAADWELPAALVSNSWLRLDDVVKEVARVLGQGVSSLGETAKAEPVFPDFVKAQEKKADEFSGGRQPEPTNTYRLEDVIDVVETWSAKLTTISLRHPSAPAPVVLVKERGEGLFRPAEGQDLPSELMCSFVDAKQAARLLHHLVTLGKWQDR